MPTTETTLVILSGIVFLIGSTLLDRGELLNHLDDRSTGFYGILAAVAAGLIALRMYTDNLQNEIQGTLHLAGFSTQEILFGHLIGIGIAASIVLTIYQLTERHTKAVWVARLIALVFLGVVVFEIYFYYPEHIEVTIHM